MNITRRLNITAVLDRKGHVNVGNRNFTLRNGLVYVDKDIEGIENPMTRDTFTHVLLERME